MAAVVYDVITAMGAYVGGRVSAEPTTAGMLRVYLESVVGFIDTHRAQMIAMTEVMLGSGFEQGIVGDQAATSHLESILASGQSWASSARSTRR